MKKYSKTFETNDKKELTLVRDNNNNIMVFIELPYGKHLTLQSDARVGNWVGYKDGVTSEEKLAIGLDKNDQLYFQIVIDDQVKRFSVKELEDKLK